MIQKTFNVHCRLSHGESHEFSVTFSNDNNNKKFIFPINTCEQSNNSVTCLNHAKDLYNHLLKNPQLLNLSLADLIVPQEADTQPQ